MHQVGVMKIERNGGYEIRGRISSDFPGSRLFPRNPPHLVAELSTEVVASVDEVSGDLIFSVLIQPKETLVPGPSEEVEEGSEDKPKRRRR